VSPQQTLVEQSSSPPTSVMIGPQAIGPQMSGSQVTDTQVSGSSSSDCTSGSQSSGDGVEQGESPPRDTTSERRKLKWLQDTLREAQGSVGNPR
jgi:hypothetical protein